MLYNLKEVAKRGSAFAGAVGLVSALALTMLPSASFADALNPLTDRSLTLSSSSPGWAFTDGSGNPTYAAPGTGPNGQKTGETFNFRVSTDSRTTNQIKGFTFQYCTAPAGDCTAPGNGPYTDGGATSNLDVHYTSPVEGTDFEVYTSPDAADAGTGTPYLFSGNTDSSKDAVPSSGWTMTTDQYLVNAANSAGSQTENNYFNLVQTTGSGLALAPGTQVWVKLFASSTNYVTNPGGVTQPFFVRMNDYNSNSAADLLSKDYAGDPTADPNIIDGGVTVANVMNQSIHITTKVLETMSFSVGTSNPDLVTYTSPMKHGPCDPLTHYPSTTPSSSQTAGADLAAGQQDANWNLIKLGDPANDYSLSPSQSSDAYSWWRLSTNSSAGATVYYSGATLTNTENDHIKSIAETAGDNTAVYSQTGQEQFGLALDQGAVSGNDSSNAETLSPLLATPQYGNGNGTLGATSGDAQFAFNHNSLTSPQSIASESNDVIECSTGHVRYIANIEAATPAGVYTTKINYIAAPQY